MSALAMLEEVSGRGVKLLQYADNLPLHQLSVAEIEQLAETASGHGVTIELGLTGCDLALVTTYLDLARQFGARILRIAPTAEESARDNAEIAALLRDAARPSRDAGVTLAVENHFHLPSPRLVEILELVADPAVGVCLDVANSLACQEWPADTIRMLAPFAVNLHLKDYRVALDPHGVGCAMVGTPLGEGVLDIGAVFVELFAHGRDVNVILEHWLPWQGDFTASHAAELAWLDRSIARARQEPAIH
ncbi:sugar phosphate isomerase/epimerase family protein [Devosia nitrariae]|nr:TIM barrel protein [Devosia nitrariae]